MTLSWTLVLLLPAAICAVAIVVLLRSPLVRHLVDRPNARSLHAAPTPRLGGLGLMLGALPVAALAAGSQLGVALACALALALLSAVDDWRSLPVGVRLPAHLAAAAVAVLAAGATLPVWIAAALVVAIAWMTNLFNFMDGADGLAGLMATIGFGAFATAAVAAGDAPLAVACAALASAALAFLAFNVPPARVFLGDAGSVPLGFLAGVLGAYGVVAGDWPAWFPMLVFSPFVVDATVTIVRRAIRGERVWHAHREHYYQRRILAGWSPRRLAVSEGALMLATAASALLARREDEMVQCGMIVGWLVVYAVLAATQDLQRPPTTRT